MTKLSPDGSAPVYSTYLGADGFDHGLAIAVDRAGNTYVTGKTTSPNFPTTLGAFQTALSGSFGEEDTFVTKVNPTGTGLVYSTYLGGRLFDSGGGIAVDVQGNAYVTGTTRSPDFPTTPGAFQTTTTPGGFDAFVTKLNFVTTTQFVAFGARVEIEDERNEHEFEVKGTFTLGTGSDGIHPDTEDVTLRVGAFSVKIAAGSLRRDKKGRFKYEGVIDGVALEAVIRQRGPSTFEFKVEGKGAGLTRTTNSVEVTLTIGNDGGNTITVNAKRDD